MSGQIPIPVFKGDVAVFQQALLGWYQKNSRPMPWRETQDAYKIWLSEVMLQQTTVAAVVPYYKHFLAQFPTVQALAAADEQAVLHAWQGLGYYSRARNLHKCAKVLVAEHGGVFPAEPAVLQTFPGIGPYTSHAIAAFAFDAPAAVLDGNVERVLTRLTCYEIPLSQAKKPLFQLAEQLAAGAAPKAYNNAIMELGATVCTPKTPRCDSCPVQKFCGAFKTCEQESFPKKMPKKKAPLKTGTVVVFENEKGEVYFQQRPEKGLLANLWELPHVGWESATLNVPDAFQILESEYTSQIEVAKPNGKIRHVFTHLKLELEVVHVPLYTEKYNTQNQMSFFSLNTLPPLSKLMQKVVSHVYS